MGLVRWLWRVLPVLANPFAAIFVLIATAILLGVLWFNQSGIAAGAVQNLSFEVEFHAYMIGLAIPEGFLIGLMWNPDLRRYVSPLSGRMISGGLGLGLSVVYAFFGFFVFRPWLESEVTAWLTPWAESPFWSLLGYWVYCGVMLILLPLTALALVSPAGTRLGLRWLAKLLW